jgi:hypothetical protein
MIGINFHINIGRSALGENVGVNIGRAACGLSKQYGIWVPTENLL